MFVPETPSTLGKLRGFLSLGRRRRRGSSDGGQHPLCLIPFVVFVMSVIALPLVIVRLSGLT